MTRKKKVFIGFLSLLLLIIGGTELVGGAVRWFRFDADLQHRGNFHSEWDNGERFTFANDNQNRNKQISKVEWVVRPGFKWFGDQSPAPGLKDPIEVKGVKIHLDRIDMKVDGAYWVPFRKQANGSVWLAYYGTLPDGTRFWGEIEGDARCSGLGFCSSIGFRERIERFLLETIREDLAKDIESRLKK